QDGQPCAADERHGGGLGGAVRRRADQGGPRGRLLEPGGGADGCGDGRGDRRRARHRSRHPQSGGLMHRLWLIGLREFKAYVATLSFWIALAIGPLLMLGAAGVLSAVTRPPPTLRIVVAASDPALRADAQAALADLSDLMSRPLILADVGQTRVRLTQSSAGVDALIEGEPLTPAAR